jgi:hypothetical protein
VAHPGSKENESTIIHFTVFATSRISNRSCPLTSAVFYSHYLNYPWYRKHDTRSMLYIANAANTTKDTCVWLFANKPGLGKLPQVHFTEVPPRSLTTVYITYTLYYICYTLYVYIYALIPPVNRGLAMKCFQNPHAASVQIYNNLKPYRGRFKFWLPTPLPLPLTNQMHLMYPINQSNAFYR